LKGSRQKIWGWRAERKYRNALRYRQGLVLETPLKVKGEKKRGGKYTACDEKVEKEKNKKGGNYEDLS